MSAPAGYVQLPSGFWVAADGSGPYFVNVATGATQAVSGSVGVVAGDSAAATATENTAAIQAALTAGGLVQITTPGLIYINSTLTIYSNTRLVLGPATTIKAITVAANAGLPLLINSGYSRATRAVTVTWSSGSTASVADAAHGLVVGQSVCISGLATSHFNGVFKIVTVTDADNYVVNLWRLPAGSPTGTAAAKTADTNIHISGGKWDYSDNTATTATNRHAIILGFFDSSSVRDVTINNVQKFGLNVGAMRDVVIHNLGAEETSSDIVKVYGPAKGVRVSQIWGACGDDGFSFQTKEPAAFSAYSWTFGDVMDCVLDGITAESTIANVAAAYCSTDEYFGGVKYKNISGKCPVAGLYINSGTYTGATLDNVEADGIAGQCVYQVRIGGASGTLIANKITLKNLSLQSSTTTNGQWCAIDASVPTIRQLEFDGASLDNAAWPGTTAYLIGMNGGTVGEMVLRGISINGNSLGRCLQVSAGALSKVIFYAPRVGSGDNLVVVASGVTGTPDFQVIGGHISCAAIINSSSTCSASFTGVTFTSATNGVLRTGGTPTIAMRSGGGNVLSAGSWAVVPSGTPVLTFYGWDIAIDPLTLTGVAATNGQFITSTQAGADGGPSVRAAAGWVALGSGGAGANTVIT